MSDYLDPEDVFTPSNPPTGENNIYVSRLNIENKLRRALKSRVPIVFGNYGVGKTTLCIKVLESAYAEEIIVRITDPSAMEMGSLFKRGFEEIGYEVTVNRTESRASGIDIGASAQAQVSNPLFNLFNLGGSLSIKKADSAEEGVTKKLLVDEPTDFKAIEIFRDNKVIFFIDELHMSTEEFRWDLSRLIKSVSDLSFQYPKFIFSGTANDPSSLAQSNQGIDRILEEVPVPPLAEGEGKSLLSEGFNKLQIRIDDKAIEQVVRVSGGAPSLIHSIGIALAYIAEDRGERIIKREDVSTALEVVIKEGSHERMTDRYKKAANHTGARKYRTQILHAMASAEEAQVETGWLAEEISRRLGEKVEMQAISGPLRELKSEEYGGILADASAADGSKLHNQSMFKQPQMKSFVQFLENAQNAGAEL
ncbi:ATP-binding protein [Corynebacterium halotolerans]|uniref:ATP-binding protein n=1 Tax=Corynebacterium halotolerans TaxID=225326 RepID=UPI000A3F3FD9|nr:ATP-binding protein [Corynebacterium halotolerans]